MGNEWTRRQALWSGAAALAGVGARSAWAQANSKRPAAGDRKFRSAVVEAYIERTRRRIGDPTLAELFANCYPNTLDTDRAAGELRRQAGHGGADRRHRGDVAARLIGAGVAIPAAGEGRPEAAELLEGIIRRQARCILIDRMPTRSWLT